MIGERLKEIRQAWGFKQTDFADKFGIKGNTVSKYESNTIFPSDDILKLLSDEGVDLNWLLTGDGSMFKGAGKIPPPAGCMERTGFVQVLDGKVSAGPGIDNGEIVVCDFLPVPLSIIQPFSQERVKAMVIEGDSMTPTIYSGDFVLYVPGEVKGNGIYVIDVFGELRCKRLEFRLNGDILVISDNDRYGKESFGRDDQTVRVVGWVCGWIHRNIY